MSNPPEAPYSLYLPYLVSEALDEFFDRAEAGSHYDEFAASLDLIYTTLRESPQDGEEIELVEWQGWTFQSRIFTTPFLVVVYFIDEAAREVTIFRPIKLMNRCSFE